MVGTTIRWNSHADMMQRLHKTRLLIAAVALAAMTAMVVACGGQSADTVQVADTSNGAAAELAPDFTLPDANAAAGSEISLAQYRGDRSVVLVFYRAYW